MTKKQLPFHMTITCPCLYFKGKDQMYDPMIHCLVNINHINTVQNTLNIDLHISAHSFSSDKETTLHRRTQEIRSKCRYEPHHAKIHLQTFVLSTA